jgi:hypothetical protein
MSLKVARPQGKAEFSHETNLEERTACNINYAKVDRQTWTGVRIWTETYAGKNMECGQMTNQQNFLLSMLVPSRCYGEARIDEPSRLINTLIRTITLELIPFPVTSRDSSRFLPPRFHIIGRSSHRGN